MYVKRGLPNYLLFVKTNYYCNEQLFVHGKVDHNILYEKRNRLQSVCIKGDLNLDIAQKEHEL